MEPLTHRDLDDTPDDGCLYEIIDGALHVTPFPDEAHHAVISSLHLLIGAHVRAQRLGKVYVSGLKVVLDEPTGVGPDLVYISAARMGGMQADGFHGAPDLLVEVVSTRPALDRRLKLEKYAQAGVPHYWIADPHERLLDVFRLGPAGYVKTASLRERGVFAPEIFPGLTFDVAELWR